jgi:hypothetical protein
MEVDAAIKFGYGYVRVINGLNEDFVDGVEDSHRRGVGLECLKM